MENLWQIIITAVGASGVVGAIITTMIKKQMDKQYAHQEKREKLRDESFEIVRSSVRDLCFSFSKASVVAVSVRRIPPETR